MSTFSAISLPSPIATDLVAIEFDRARSALIDTFCELDIVVSQWLRHIGEESSASCSFGIRLASLATSDKLQDKASKKQIKHIQSLPKNLGSRLILRNLLVHHRRSCCTKDGVEHLMLQSIEDAAAGIHRYLLITADEIWAARSEIANHANHLRLWLNQPSSRQPPSPDATAAP